MQPLIILVNMKKSMLLGEFKHHQWCLETRSTKITNQALWMSNCHLFQRNNWKYSNGIYWSTWSVPMVMIKRFVHTLFIRAMKPFHTQRPISQEMTSRQKKRTRHTEEHDYNNESDEDYEEPPSYDEDPSDEDYSIETDEEIATPNNPSPSRRLTRSTSKSSSCTDSSSKDLCSSDNTNGSNQCMTSESPSKKNKTSNPSTPERNIGLSHEERSWQLFIEEEIDLIKKDLKH